MARLHFFITLLLPSFLSTWLVSLSCAAFLAWQGWQFIQQQQLFYEVLFGPFGFVTSSITTSSSESILSALLRSEVAYFVIIFSIAVVVSFTIFVILQAFLRVKQDGMTVFEAIRNHGSSNLIYQRSMVRIISLLGWLTYGFVSIMLIVPFCISLLQIGLTDMASNQMLGVLSCLGSFILLWLTAHLHIVFARLIALRLRLLDNSTAQLIELESEHE